QTQELIPTEQVVEIKPVTVEEIIEQTIVTSVEQPEPVIESQDNKVVTTTQVEEQPLLQATVGATSIQPETEGYVNSNEKPTINKGQLDDTKLKITEIATDTENNDEKNVRTTDTTNSKESMNPVVTVEQETVQTENLQILKVGEKHITTTVSDNQILSEIPINTINAQKRNLEILNVDEQTTEYEFVKKPDSGNTIVEDAISQEPVSLVTIDTSPIIHEVTHEQKKTEKHTKTSTETESTTKNILKQADEPIPLLLEQECVMSSTKEQTMTNDVNVLESRQLPEKLAQEVHNTEQNDIPTLETPTTKLEAPKVTVESVEPIRTLVDHSLPKQTTQIQEDFSAIEKSDKGQPILYDDLFTNETMQPVQQTTSTIIEEPLRTSNSTEQNQEPEEIRTESIIQQVTTAENISEENSETKTANTEEFTIGEKNIHEYKTAVDAKQEHTAATTSTTGVEIDDTLTLTPLLDEEPATRVSEVATTEPHEIPIGGKHNIPGTVNIPTEKQFSIDEMNKIEIIPAIGQTIDTTETEQTVLNAIFSEIKRETKSDENVSPTEQITTTTVTIEEFAINEDVTEEKKASVDEQPKETTNTETVSITEETAEDTPMSTAPLATGKSETAKVIAEEEGVPTNEQPKRTNGIDMILTTRETVEDTLMSTASLAEEKPEVESTPRVSDQNTTELSMKPVADEQIDEKHTTEQVLPKTETEPIVNEEVTEIETIRTIDDTVSETARQDIVQNAIFSEIEEEKKSQENVFPKERVTTNEDFKDKKIDTPTVTIEQLPTNEVLTEEKKASADKQLKETTDTETVPTTEETTEDTLVYPAPLVVGNTGVESTLRALDEDTVELNQKPLADHEISTETEKPIVPEQFTKPETISTVDQTNDMTDSEQTITNAIFSDIEKETKLDENVSPTEQVTTSEDFNDEKSEISTMTIEELIISEDVTEEKKGAIDEQSKLATDTGTIQTTVPLAKEKLETTTGAVEQLTTTKDINEEQKILLDEQLKEAAETEMILPTEEIIDDTVIPKASVAEEISKVETVKSAPQVSDVATSAQIEKLVVDQPIEKHLSEIEKNMQNEKVTEVQQISRTEHTVDDVVVVPEITENAKTGDIVPIVEQIIFVETFSEENPEKPGTMTVEEPTTIEEIHNKEETSICQQQKHSTETTLTTEEGIDETLTVKTPVAQETLTTQVIDSTPHFVEEETMKQTENPIIDHVIETKPRKGEILPINENVATENPITKDEITTIETIPITEEALSTIMGEEIIESIVSTSVKEELQPRETFSNDEQLTTIQHIDDAKSQTTQVPMEENVATKEANAEENVATKEANAEENVTVDEEQKYPSQVATETATALTTEEQIADTLTPKTQLVSEIPTVQTVELEPHVFEKETMKQLQKPIEDQQSRENSTVEKTLPTTEYTSTEKNVVQDDSTTIETTQTGAETEKVVPNVIFPKIEEQSKSDETVSQTEQTTTNEDLAEEKPEIATVATKEFTSNEGVTEEEKVPVHEQQKETAENDINTISNTREHVKETSIPKTRLFKNTSEAEDVGSISPVFEDEATKELEKPSLSEQYEEMTMVGGTFSRAPVTVIEKKASSAEQVSPKISVSSEEVSAFLGVPTIMQHSSTVATNEIIEEDVSSGKNDAHKPIGKSSNVEPNMNIGELLEQGKLKNVPDEQALEKNAPLELMQETLKQSPGETNTMDETLIHKTVEIESIPALEPAEEEQAADVATESSSHNRQDAPEVAVDNEDATVVSEAHMHDHQKQLKVFELPVQRVQENSDVTVTIQVPISTNLVLLKDGIQQSLSDHVEFTPISYNSVQLNIKKVKLDDEGEYVIQIDETQQPIMKLQVTPAPVIRQEMQLPKTEFNQNETLTIACQFDASPEEPFIFLHNDQPIVPDSRVTTVAEDNKYTITVKDLRPDEDGGVYTLKSDHLILDTPNITVVPQEKKPDIETKTIEEELVFIVPDQAQSQPATQTEEEQVTKILEETKPEEKSEIPIQEVEATTTVTLTVQLPESTLHKEVILLKNNEELNPSEHIKVTKTSPTTIEIQIIRAKPDDEGKYSVLVDGKEQPVMQLKVIPKPVIHQIMELPQTKFKEGETLTIKCQFDTIPEET
ncbi:unnamed protein product, partial [Rotaria magnacalcarata]